MLSVLRFALGERMGWRVSFHFLHFYPLSGYSSCTHFIYTHNDFCNNNLHFVSAPKTEMNHSNYLIVIFGFTTILLPSGSHCFFNIVVLMSVSLVSRTDYFCTKHGPNSSYYIISVFLSFESYLWFQWFPWFLRINVVLFPIL